MGETSGFYVAVIGGACSGSEAAFQLAERGVKVVVFDQQPLPYGKIEDGLPKWHVKLRDKEEGKIDSKLTHPNVTYIPNTRIGRDVSFPDLLDKWGFSLVLLASGAWRDRPLPVAGVDQYINKGFYYQNPFVDWFNHNHEPEQSRGEYPIEDGTIIVGGGLASVDVAKIVMMELTLKALADRGIKATTLDLEHRGIPAFLESHGLKFEDLNLKGCTVFYRRRIQDMPLSPVPDGADEERLAKVASVRERILSNAREKFCFGFQELSVPLRPIVDGDRLGGLVFQKTRIENGRAVAIPDSEFDVPSPLVISSIGSIPEPLPGLPVQGELLKVADEETGKIDAGDRIYALGNAVTGRGNIRESELHARKVAAYLLEEILQVDGDGGAGFALSGDQFAGIEKLASELHAKIGYRGYEDWVNAHRPVRLENM
ncbi:MAG TPA: FAD-dependent oxidoreductase [Calditrichia bacterium]|nr:FAD-dependent oxidoreductase [Calditrichota bacterium]HQU70864.1 FAD-dependent oxidoreductase [Calditrichia bacterium]HQV30441.1 FAD-dependent oxidoreductase [Calditrichia bacterium]